jgi:hypothetical protein
LIFGMIFLRSFLRHSREGGYGEALTASNLMF